MTLARFAVRALLLAGVAAAALWFAAEPVTRVAASMVKVVHAALGLPAPDLLVDLTRMHTVSLALPLLAGLALASTWRSWSDRMIAVSTGGLVVFVLLLMDITLAYSPYLPASPLPQQIRQSAILFAALPLQVILWYAMVGPPPTAGDQAAGQPSRSRVRRPLLVVMIATVAAALLIGVCAVSGRADDRHRRRQLADALRRDPPVALQRVFQILRSAPDDMNVAYLGARLAQRSGREDVARVMLYQSCVRSGLRHAYFREYPQPPRLPSATMLSEVPGDAPLSAAPPPPGRRVAPQD